MIKDYRKYVKGKAVCLLYYLWFPAQRDLSAVLLLFIEKMRRRSLA